jgi:hypothetical protein
MKNQGIKTNNGVTALVMKEMLVEISAIAALADN